MSKPISEARRVSRARQNRVRRIKRALDRFVKEHGKERAAWLLADVARAGHIGIAIDRNRGQ